LATWTPASFYLKTSSGTRKCKLASVDDTQLTCQHGSKPASIFQRDDIKSIKFTQRGVSSAYGLLVGAGTGALIGVASQPSCNGGCFINTHALGGAVGAVVGGIVGIFVGFGRDLNRGRTLYQAP